MPASVSHRTTAFHLTTGLDTESTGLRWRSKSMSMHSPFHMPHPWPTCRNSWQLGPRLASSLLPSHPWSSPRKTAWLVSVEDFCVLPSFLSKTFKPKAAFHRCSVGRYLNDMYTAHTGKFSLFRARARVLSPEISMGEKKSVCSLLSRRHFCRKFSHQFCLIVSQKRLSFLTLYVFRSIDWYNTSF